MNAESSVVNSLVDLLVQPLLVKLQPEIDSYIESKAAELQKQAMPEVVRRKDFPKYTGYSCSTFDKWAADGMPVIKGNGKNSAVAVRKQVLMQWLEEMEI